MSNRAVLRLQRELNDIASNPDPSFKVHASDQNLFHVHALVYGGEGTPYAYGLFDVVLDFPSTYPANSPSGRSLTTNNGTTRFAPNVYACGKLCVSILGTWRGTEQENWSDVHGLSSTLIAIQSLLSDVPYQNEPGHEKVKSTDAVSIDYNRKIVHETIRITVLDRLEPCFAEPNPQAYKIGFCSCREDRLFVDEAKLHVLLNYENILELISNEKPHVKPGQEFKQTPFEHTTNAMRGHFQYDQLEERLKKLFANLEKEWKVDWIQESKKQSECRINHYLRTRFDEFKRTNVFEGKLDFSLEDDNPFVWNIAIYGQRISHFEGGLFSCRMVFPINFPDVQPRVQFSMSIPHPNISPSGYPFLKPPKKAGNIQGWLEEIFNLFDSDPNPDTHAWINLTASKLCFAPGSEQEKGLKKKEYTRLCRRATQRSIE